MNIEEIKEWRKHTLRVYGIHTDTLEVIDTLLVEVATLEKHNASSDQAVVELDQKLTVATEALGRTVEIYSDPCMNNGFKLAEIVHTARTALKRVKG